MTNKLGLSECKVKDIEKIIINTKLHLLDEYFTFNKDSMNFEYLKSINDFLFIDIYNKENIGIRNITKEELKMLNYYLEEIEILCINPNYKEDVLNKIKEIWYLQPFRMGNTRTMIAFLIILDKAFRLGLNINPDINIENNPSIFDLNNLVNQKRLTKIK